MNTRVLIVLSCCALSVSASAQFATLSREMQSKSVVRPKAEIKARPFALNRVRLLDSPFKTAMETDLKYLLTVEPKRLLHRFYLNAGLPTKGDIYGGWESDTLSGHTLGHYLSGCSMMYASTGDQRMLARVDEILAELALCQAEREDGLVSGVPDIAKVFKEVSSGVIRSSNFDLNGLWAPWYVQHKLISGLTDAYLYCDKPQALEIAKGVCDWAISVTKDLSDEHVQEMLGTEHGGMNEAAANVFALTGERKYLDLALTFHHKFVLDPLEEGKRQLTGLHGNTQIPKVIGTAREYELTGEQRFKDISRNFWDEVTEDHTYANGGNTFGEYFGPPGELSERLGYNTTETCNTYNMLKLTQHLFAWEPSVKVADYYERALFNHILASQNRTTAGVTYFVPLQSGSQKRFSGPLSGFSCCHGSGMENHAKYGASIYFESGDTLYVGQFISSTLDWKEKGVKVTMESKVPHSEEVDITFEMDEPTEFTIKIRCPEWIQNANVIGVIGDDLIGMGNAGEFMTITRVWQPGTKLLVDVPPSLRTEPMPDNPKRVALFYGPALLAGVWPDSERRQVERVPVLVTGERFTQQWLKQSTKDTAIFSSQNAIMPRDMEFIPFYEVQDERYSVYFDYYTPDEWTKRETEYVREEERLAELARITVDHLDLGSRRQEQRHNLQSENSSSGRLGQRGWRHAWEGGWFSFDLELDPDATNQLMLTYFGGDGGRTFEIVVEGEVIATQRLNRSQPGKFFDVRHDLPDELIKGKEKVTVKIQCVGNSRAGGLFDARIVRK